jgi:hypothetical protein
MLLMSGNSDIHETLTAMSSYVQRLLTELIRNKRYGDFTTFVALVEMMRRWGADPDPGSIMLRMLATMAEGPELSDEAIIGLRYSAGFGHLDLSRLQLKGESLAAIPNDVEPLALVDVPITDASIDYLLSLSKLSRLNLAGTQITDAGLDRLASARALRWLNVERTQVSEAGMARLTANLPGLEVVR